MIVVNLEVFEKTKLNLCGEKPTNKFSTVHQIKFDGKLQDDVVCDCFIPRIRSSEILLRKHQQALLQVRI